MGCLARKCFALNLKDDGKPLRVFEQHHRSVESTSAGDSLATKNEY